MSDTFDTPTSVIEGSNTAIQPSNHSLLLQLPTELLAHIALDVANKNMEEISPDYRDLLALRL